MLKIGAKRRRTREEILDAKAEAEVKRQAVEAQVQEIIKLKSDLEKAQKTA